MDDKHWLDYLGIEQLRVCFYRVQLDGFSWLTHVQKQVFSVITRLISTRLILQLLVGELAEIICLMAESAPVETVHLNYPSNCMHGCTYTIGQEDHSLRLLREWVVFSQLLRFVQKQPRSVSSTAFQTAFSLTGKFQKFCRNTLIVYVMFFIISIFSSLYLESKTDQQKLMILQRKDKQLIQLEQLLQHMREDRDCQKQQLGQEYTTNRMWHNNFLIYYLFLVKGRGLACQQQ